MGASRERHTEIQAAVAVSHEHQGKGAASARKPRVLAAKHGAQGVATATGAEPELAGVASADDPAARVRHFWKAVFALVRRVLLATGRQGQPGLCGRVPRVHVMLLMRELLLHCCFVGGLEPGSFDGRGRCGLRLRPGARLCILLQEKRPQAQGVTLALSEVLEPRLLYLLHCGLVLLILQVLFAVQPLLKFKHVWSVEDFGPQQLRQLLPDTRKVDVSVEVRRRVGLILDGAAHGFDQPKHAACNVEAVPRLVPAGAVGAAEAQAQAEQGAEHEPHHGLEGSDHCPWVSGGELSAGVVAWQLNVRLGRLPHLWRIAGKPGPGHVAGCRVPPAIP